MPDDNRRDRLSRRKALELIGVGSVAGLAGCSGNSGDNTQTSGPGGNATSGPNETATSVSGGTATSGSAVTETSGSDNATPSGTAVDNTLETGGLSADLTQYDFRPGAKNPLGPVNDLVFAPTFLSFPTTEGITPCLLKNFEEDGEWAYFDVVEGSTWHDGSPVTPEDIAFNYNFEMWRRSGLFLSVNKEVEVTDDGRIKISRMGIDQKGNTYKTTRSVWMRQVGGQPIKFKPEHWQWGLDLLKEQTNGIGDIPDVDWGLKGQLTNAILSPSNTESEIDDIEGGPRNADDVDWPMGTGLWNMQAVTANRVDFQKHEGHFLSDQFNFDQLKVRNVTPQTLQASIANDDVDIVEQPLTDAIERARQSGQIGDHWHYADVPDFGGKTFLFTGVQKSPVRNRDVRAAIAHAIDREGIAGNLDNATAWKVPINIPSQGGLLNQWFDQATIDEFIKYTDQQRGAELLQRQGFEKQGGTWTATESNSDWGISAGDPLQITLSTENSNTDSIIGQTAASNLKEFGFDVQYKSLNPQAFGNQARTESQISLYNNTGSTGPWGAYGRMGAMVGREGRDWGWPLNTKIPPFGEPDAERSVEVNMRTLKDTKFLSATSTSEATEIAKMMTWYQNWYLAELPLIETTSSQFLSFDDWTYEGIEKPSQFKIPVQEDVPAIWGSGSLKETIFYTRLINGKPE